MLLLVAQGLLPVGLVSLTRLLVDRLVAAMQTGGNLASLQPVLIPAGLMAAVLLLAEFLQGLGDWVRTAQAELIEDHISGQVHAKAISVDLAFYESAEYYDHLHRAANEASNRPLALLENAGGLAQNCLTLVGMAALLVPYGGWVPLALFASALPSLLVVVRSNRRTHRWWERTTADRRWVQYYDAMLTHRDVAAELRLFDLGGHFRSAYTALRRRMRTERLDILRDSSLARVGAGSLALAVAGGALIWLLRRALLGQLTLGDLALFYQAFNRTQTVLRLALTNLAQIYSNSLYLGNLFAFLNLVPQVNDPPQPLSPPASLAEGIRFHGVNFSYPGSSRPALRDFDLFLPAGQVTAIVGPNGAGKSTLIKLLCRFYDPQTGRIELDGMDLRSLSLAELRRRISILFQFPVHYHATVAQNIALGDLKGEHGQEELAAASRAAGAEEVIARLPGGYDTPLGRWFANGEELSAGEWQRLALARAYLRRAPVIVLDEPTSFMDSWSEIEWFDRFKALAAGRTAIMITHRFTIAMRADLIHVMNAGQIVETGTHSELLTFEGLYASSWSHQMQAAPDLTA